MSNWLIIDEVPYICTEFSVDMERNSTRSSSAGITVGGTEVTLTAKIFGKQEFPCFDSNGVPKASDISLISGDTIYEFDDALLIINDRVPHHDLPVASDIEILGAAMDKSESMDLQRRI